MNTTNSRAGCLPLLLADAQAENARRWAHAAALGRQLDDAAAWRAEAADARAALRGLTGDAHALQDQVDALTAERDELSAAIHDERRARREAEAALDVAEDEASARADIIADLEPRLFAVAEERDRLASELATVTAQRDDELGAAVAALFEADDARAACTDLADSLDGMQEVRYLALRERNEALTAGNALRERLAEAEEEIRRLADERDTAERLLAEARGYLRECGCPR